MRGIFPGCCASAGGTVVSKAVASSQTKIFPPIGLAPIILLRTGNGPLPTVIESLYPPAPTHWVESSRRSALPLFRLMMNSNFVGCSIGRSAGLVPFRILST